MHVEREICDVTAEEEEKLECARAIILIEVYSKKQLARFIIIKRHR